MMFMSRTGNVQKLSNLSKPLLRTKTIECIASALFDTKQQNRFSSSNDGDRVNDEKFDNQNSTTTASTASSKTNQNNSPDYTEERSSAAIAQQNTSNLNTGRNNKSQFISIEIFGPKDVRCSLPGNVGLAPIKYLTQTENVRKLSKKSVEKEFKLILDHDPLSKESVTSTIEFNLNNYETNEDRQNRIIENVAYNRKEECSLEHNQHKFKSLFFVKIYSSTQFLLNDIKQIFPKECLFEKDFVVITVYKNPFSKITDVNIKNEFVNMANSISDSLGKMGCWTNFMVPDSKRSYTDLMACFNFDSEERFVNYGVEITTHNNCQLIQQINSAKLFIGTVFTSAKIDSVELNRVLNFLTPL